MRIYIDCEFDRDMLLSLALVPANRTVEPFYELAQHTRQVRDPWVKENVVPILGDKVPLSRQRMATAIDRYLRQFGDIEIVADHPADIRFFCQAIELGQGRRVGPPHLRFQVDANINYFSEQPHNALADAIAIRDCMQEPKC